MSYDQWPDDSDQQPGGSAPRSGRGSRRQQFAKQAERDRGEYVEVDQRILEFYEKHPDGRLVTANVKASDKPDGVPRIWVQAMAFRSPEDDHPGIGWSWMVLPGTTPYTRGSELENTETSAWGRAIAALGIAVRTGIATRQEIDNKRGPEEAPEQAVVQTAAEAVALAVADGAPVAPEAPPVNAEAHAAPETPTDTPAAEEPVPVSPDAPDADEPVLLSFESFMARCKERYIPAPTISKQARDAFGDSATSIRELTDQQRGYLWQVLDALVPGAKGSPEKSA